MYHFHRLLNINPEQKNSVFLFGPRATGKTTWIRDQVEVDFVAYGEKGLLAFEIKRSHTVTTKDLKGLKLFGSDYETADLYLLYGGDHAEYHDNIQVLPFTQTLFRLHEILAKETKT